MNKYDNTNAITVTHKSFTTNTTPNNASEDKENFYNKKYYYPKMKGWKKPRFKSHKKPD